VKNTSTGFRARREDSLAVRHCRGLRRPLNVVDDEELAGARGRFEFQAELFLNAVKIERLPEESSDSAANK
jgi:hypothetical protein